jgi:deoxyadenosine/deoxycytidine kinase
MPKQDIVVICGLPGLGKSYDALLVERKHRVVVVAKGETRNDFSFYAIEARVKRELALINNLARDGTLYVFDRMFADEIVFGCVLNRPNYAMTKKYVKNALASVADRLMFKYYTTRDFINLCGRLSGRGRSPVDSMWTPQLLEALHLDYETLFEEYNVPVVRIIKELEIYGRRDGTTD